MRAGIKQEPVGVAQLVAAVAEAAQAEEVQGSQDAGAGGGKAGSVSACALKAALEEERSVPVENEELEAVVEPELKKQAVGV